MDKHIIIHGNNWKTDDIKEQIEWAKKQKWQKTKWVPRAALVSKGKTSEYISQSFDPKYTELVKEGWNHDHCEICWWSLRESEDPEIGEGYTTDGRDWVCSECYTKFIKGL